MKHAKLIFALVVLVLVGGLLALFVIQNLERTTDLSLNLIFFHRHLAQPVSVPLLLIGTFAAGGFFGLIAGLLLRGRKRSAGLETGTNLDDAWA
jgi:hypothetical protein